MMSIEVTREVTNVLEMKSYLCTVVVRSGRLESSFSFFESFFGVDFRYVCQWVDTKPRIKNVSHPILLLCADEDFEG
jgi:hypothetical protein